MKLLQETTSDWKDPTPNHIYIFDGSDMKIVGFIPVGKREPFFFSKPIMFDKRGRTFTKLNLKELARGA